MMIYLHPYAPLILYKFASILGEKLKSNCNWPQV